MKNDLFNAEESKLIKSLESRILRRETLPYDEVKELIKLTRNLKQSVINYADALFNNNPDCDR